MIHALLAILACQLAGEVAARLTGLPVPGPVIGLVLLSAALSALPRLRDIVRPVAQGILGNLSLLFVPAGVGVMGHLSSLGAHAGALAVILLGSTAAAIAVGALTFTAVARLTGSRDD